MVEPHCVQLLGTWGKRQAFQSSGHEWNVLLNVETWDSQGLRQPGIRYIQVGHNEVPLYRVLLLLFPAAGQPFLGVTRGQRVCQIFLCSDLQIMAIKKCHLTQCKIIVLKTRCHINRAFTMTVSQYSGQTWLWGRRIFVYHDCHWYH